MDARILLALFDGTNETYPSGCEVIDMKLGAAESDFAKMVQTARRIICLRKIKKKFNVDVSLSLLTSPNFVNVLSRYKEKVIVSERNLISRSANSIREKRMVKYVCRKADKVISLSEMVKRDLVENFGADPEKTATVYNSCDGERLMKLSCDSDVVAPEFPYVVTMGRLMRQKGHWHLVRAFSVIHARYPDLKLIILGEGEYCQQLKQLIHKMNLDDAVYLYGYIKNPHVIIRSAKAFLFTSLFEGLGNVLLEAMACGTPIVSADCIAGPREILTGGIDYDGSDATKGIEYAPYGILTKAFDPAEQLDFDSVDITREEQIFAEAVMELLSSDELLTHYRNQSLIRSKDFSDESVLKKWIGAIEA